jgi:hypothetical protein
MILCITESSSHAHLTSITLASGVQEPLHTYVAISIHTALSSSKKYSVESDTLKMASKQQKSHLRPLVMVESIPPPKKTVFGKNTSCAYFPIFGDSSPLGQSL